MDQQPLDDPAYAPQYPPVAGMVPSAVARWGAASQLRWFRRFRGQITPMRGEEWARFFCVSAAHRGQHCGSCLDDLEDGFDNRPESLCCCAGTTQRAKRLEQSSADPIEPQGRQRRKMKIEYLPKTFNAMAASVIDQAEAFCDEYDRQGYKITLRQLYYRFIALDAFPESRRDEASGTKNTEKNYKWLGQLISDARLAGLIDWDHLEDRGRAEQGGDFGWSSPEHMIRSYARNYDITHWDGQDHYVEVWVEKQALEDVVSRPASRWKVPYFACKGYVSQSSMHEAANRIRKFADAGKECTIIHLGDHDPSGIDMTRDIADRMTMFGTDVAVERIALNMDQIEAFDPPPSPAKITDSRAADYIERFHDSDIDDLGTARCWELDALEPAQLEALVEDAVTSRLDMALWDEREERQERERAVLTAVSSNFDAIRSYMRREGML